MAKIAPSTSSVTLNNVVRCIEHAGSSRADRLTALKSSIPFGFGLKLRMLGKLLVAGSVLIRSESPRLDAGVFSVLNTANAVFDDVLADLLDWGDGDFKVYPDGFKSLLQNIEKRMEEHDIPIPSVDLQEYRFE
mmetsp:Transcript_3858/g.5866  ORF Transcript_3858/g.5866 Transcript_3858/m.5866 type:complete len:134 (+) Transcript_3858:96-497(+)